MRYEIDHPLIVEMENKRAKEQKELEAIRRREEAERRRLLAQPKPDSFEYQYQRIEKEITEAVEGGTKKPIKAVQNILQQFSPKTKVENFNSRKNKNRDAEALITLDFAEKSKKDGTEVRKKPSTVFLKNIDKKSPDKERFIQSALHESIHMLQEQSSDRESIENFLNQYFSKTKDKKLCQMTRVALFDSFREAEIELHNIREELYSNKANLRTIEFDPDNYDTINFLLSRREEDALSKRISKKIDKAVKENPQIVKHFGKKMIYEFFLLSAISELEAYERSDYSVRKMNNTGRSPYQRTIIALYKALQTICETRIKYDGNLFK